MDVARWGLAGALGASLSAVTQAAPEARAASPHRPQPGPARSMGPVRDLAALRTDVAATLNDLSARIEQTLPQALAAAAQAWDRVDHLLTFVDPTLAARIAGLRRRLDLTASATDAAPSLRAGAIEGLLAIDAASGLARLYEQRLSSLIRLRVRSGDDELLPQGRPFLDVAAALKAAARAWA